jgi:hypothetical protein
VDEVVIHVAPVLIGDGIRLFGQMGMEPASWRRPRLGSGGKSPTCASASEGGPRIHYGIHEEEVL